MVSPGRVPNEVDRAGSRTITGGAITLVTLAAYAALMVLGATRHLSLGAFVAGLIVLLVAWCACQAESR